MKSQTSYELRPMYTSSSSDDDMILDTYKKKRYQEIKSVLLPNISEIITEDELIAKTKSEKMIVHFYKEGFRFCKEMDAALKNIVKDYETIKFYRIAADICPLVSEKLKISVLPFLGFFKNGYFVGQHVGFERVGDTHCDKKRLKEVINESELVL